MNTVNLYKKTLRKSFIKLVLVLAALAAVIGYAVLSEYGIV